jgi:hypothetical protein
VFGFSWYAHKKLNSTQSCYCRPPIPHFVKCLRRRRTRCENELRNQVSEYLYQDLSIHGYSYLLFTVVQIRRVDLCDFVVLLVMSIKFMIFLDVLPYRLVNEGGNMFLQNTGTFLRNQMSSPLR